MTDDDCIGNDFEELVLELMMPKNDSEQLEIQEDSDTVAELFEFVENNTAALVATGTSLAFLAAISPPTLPTFPPMGLLQPSSTLGGGGSGAGFTPSSVVGVNIS